MYPSPCLYNTLLKWDPLLELTIGVHLQDIADAWRTLGFFYNRCTVNGNVLRKGFTIEWVGMSEDISSYVKRRGNNLVLGGSW